MITLFQISILFVYLSQAEENWLYKFRVLLSNSNVEKILEKVMVAQPLPVRADRQDKKVVETNRSDHLLPVVRLIRGQWTQDCLAQVGVELVQQGGAQEKGAHFGRLLIKHLLTQVVEQFHAGSARSP